MISFALESPGFESHTDILSFLSNVYVVSIITARQRTLLKILICDYSSGISYSQQNAF